MPLMFINRKNLLIFLFIIAFIIFSYTRALRENEFGDFHVFWFAAKTLLDGGDLYQVLNGWRAFFYPPFAAFVFLPLAIFPFKIACFLFFILNGFLFLATYKLNSKVLKYLGLSKHYNKIFNVIGCILIFKISWNNLMMIQVNQMVYIFIYLGILNFFNKNENWSVFWLSVAISIKVFPIIFAFWLVIRGSWKVFFKFTFWAIIFISIPMFFTGYKKGSEQLNWYLNSYVLNRATIQELAAGYASQSIPSLLGRVLTSPVKQSSEPDYSLINLSSHTTRKIIFASQVFLFAILIFCLSFREYHKVELSPLEPSLVILTMHLISTTTWKAHMVGLFLPFSILGGYFYLKWEKRNLSLLDLIFILFSMLVCFLGQVIVGKKVQMYLGAYGDYTFVMIFSLVYLYYLILNLKFFDSCLLIKSK